MGDLANLSAQLCNRVILDLRTGRIGDAAAHLREQLQIAMQTGLRSVLLIGLDCCGHLCAATQRPAEAVTVWAAMLALAGPEPLPHDYGNLGERAEILAEARQRLGPAAARAAQERGAAMSLATATEYALLLAAAEPPATGEAGDRPAADRAGTATGLPKLSPRERELVTLVAQGRTDAQIATQLYITVRTVSSHLDRIRDKTGCRRRADLTRLALSACWPDPAWPPATLLARRPPATRRCGWFHPCRGPGWSASLLADGRVSPEPAPGWRNVLS